MEKAHDGRGQASYGKWRLDKILQGVTTVPKRTLANVPLGQLYQEIRRRLQVLPKVIARRDELNRQIAELESLAKAVESNLPARKANPPR